MTMSASEMAAVGAVGRGRTESPRRRGPVRAGIAGPILWALCLATALAVVGALPVAGGAVSGPRQSLAVVDVLPSQTLWSIAAAHQVAGLSTAASVERIVRLNSLPGTRLVAGQRLLVPVPVEGVSAVAQVDGATATR